jgi:two-component system cell cycle response regulator
MIVEQNFLVHIGVNNMTQRVLIVDDDPRVLQSLMVSLSLLGNFEVVGASDGAEGLQKAVEGDFDCLVVDVKMPELNGYQLVQALRGDPLTADLPLIVLTALPQEQEQMKGFSSGADFFLVKPVISSDLIKIIQSAILISKEQREQNLRILAEEQE